MCPVKMNFEITNFYTVFNNQILKIFIKTTKIYYFVIKIIIYVYSMPTRQ